MPTGGSRLGSSLSSVTVEAKWEALFADRIKERVDQAIGEWPESTSLLVGHEDLDRYDPDLTDLTYRRPDESLAAAERVLASLGTSSDAKPTLRVRLRGAPPAGHVAIRALRSRHVGKAVVVQGLVRKATEVRGRLDVAAYVCAKCGAVFTHLQDDGEGLSEPEYCPESQGGCGQASSFRLVKEDSTFDDLQRIQVEELTETMAMPTQPQRLNCFTLAGDVIDRQRPFERIGERVRLTGVLRSVPTRRGIAVLNEFRFFLEVLDIEPMEEAEASPNISPDDERRILAMAADPENERKLVASLAPGLYGLEREKLGMWLAVIGGAPKMIGGMRVRGDIHVLYCGDPSTGKSQLLKAAQRVAPRCVYSSGKGASAAGLTAAVVRDEFDGRYTVEAGAMILANGGLLAADELDKMEERDRDALHQGMEQQEISINKAGISATFKTQCTVVAACNPSLGRFDAFSPVATQINLKPALFSRFDLIFVVKEEIEKGRDRELAALVGRMHQAGSNGHGPVTDAEAGAPYDLPILRKYVAYVRRTAAPKLTDAAVEAVNGYYVDLRARSTDAVTITTRQLEALYRISEAFARMRLAPEVGPEHAAKAIEIYESFLGGVGVDPATGRLDYDLIATGIPRSQQQRMAAIMDALHEAAKREPGSGATLDEIFASAAKRGVPRDEVEDALRQMKERGQVYQPGWDRYLPV